MRRGPHPRFRPGLLCVSLFSRWATGTSNGPARAAWASLVPIARGQGLYLSGISQGARVPRLGGKCRRSEQSDAPGTVRGHRADSTSKRTRTAGWACSYSQSFAVRVGSTRADSPSHIGALGEDAKTTRLSVAPGSCPSQGWAKGEACPAPVSTYPQDRPPTRRLSGRA
jgi:hypothetical protein